MVVPPVTTSNIATFAWYRQTGCTQVTLADCLGILHSYDQYPEYVDGTIKIFDTGAESVAPNNYVLVNVRVRKDGYILAWFAQELTPLANQTIESTTATVVTMSTTKCQIQNYHDSSARNIVANELAGNILEMTSGTMNGNKYTIQSNTTTTVTLHDKYGNNVSTDLSGETGETFRIYSSRGNLIWWGHTSSASGDPTNQSTRLARSLYEIWEQLKANQIGGSGASLDYTDVNYYDYEYTSATNLYILGYSAGSNIDKYYYFTIPAGRSVYDAICNYGYNSGTPGRFGCYIDGTALYYRIATTNSKGYVCESIISFISINIQTTIRHYQLSGHNTNTGIIILTNG